MECHQVCDTVRCAFLQPGHSAIDHRAFDFLNEKGYSVPATLSISDREKAAKDKKKCLFYVHVSARATSLDSFHPSLHPLGASVLLSFSASPSIQ